MAIGAMVVQVAGVRTNYNPLQPDDFCRRHSHASEYPEVVKNLSIGAFMLNICGLWVLAAQINDRLYIDGGYINTKASDLTNYTSKPFPSCSNMATPICD